jgi:hypothetical protein
VHHRKDEAFYVVEGKFLSMPLRLSAPAITSSEQIRASVLTAWTISFEVCLRKQDEVLEALGRDLLGVFPVGLSGRWCTFGPELAYRRIENISHPDLQSM